jgi:GNAT superfamily N-acetyltransferase
MNSIRSAVNDDAADISRILRSSIRHLCAVDHKSDETVIETWTRNKTERSVLEWMINEENLTFVHESENHQLAGVAMASKHGHILLLYVDPKAAKTGVGGRLFDHLESELRSRGVSELRADSTRTALDFYLHKGFDWNNKTESFGPLTSYSIVKDLVTAR